MGKFVEADDSTTHRRDLRSGKILIDTPIFSPINPTLEFQVWDRVYLIKVMEEGSGDVSTSESGSRAESEQSDNDELESDEDIEEDEEVEKYLNEEGHDGRLDGDPKTWMEDPLLETTEADVGNNRFEAIENIMPVALNGSENLALDTNDFMGNSVVKEGNILTADKCCTQLLVSLNQEGLGVGQ